MIALHTIRQRHSKGISVQWCVTRRKDGCAAALCISGVRMQKLSLQGRIWAIWMQMHSLKDHWCAARGLLTPAVHTELCEEGNSCLESSSAELSRSSRQACEDNQH